ncbi:MAG: hypothetical protein IJR35_08285 [Synergistaceae bacterium]|nr:hypothetical protein [Synergistaceae bacterium]MBQ9595840.1 hypothetical protein [Synergistaceae bacterium]MBR0203679.1 hypothetical protein [Synergistaceae bacterium]
MRKLLISLVIIFSLIAPVQVHAEFKVTTPSGWFRQDSGSTMVIKSLDSNASVAVAFNPLGGADFTDIVERLYIQMKGTGLAQDSDGDYSFSFTHNSGAEGVAMISESDGHYVVLTLSGFQDDEKIQNDMNIILDSVEWVD